MDTANCFVCGEDATIGTRPGGASEFRAFKFLFVVCIVMLIQLGILHLNNASVIIFSSNNYLSTAQAKGFLIKLKYFDFP